MKFVPSIRNWFSLTPEPSAETLVTDTVLVVPLAGDVGEIPGAALMKSNMLNRPVGIVLRSSGPKRASNPLPRASIREPAPWTVIDSATPASSSTTVLSIVRADADPDVLLVIRRKPCHLDVEDVRSRGQRRKPQLTLLVGRRRQLAPNERRRGDADESASQDAALVHP